MVLRDQKSTEPCLLCGGSPGTAKGDVPLYDSFRISLIALKGRSKKLVSIGHVVLYTRRILTTS